MNIKKFLILAAIGLTSSSIFAASANHNYKVSPAVVPMVNQIGTYLEFLAGYNRYDFTEALHSGLPWKHGTGNWALGGDIGYQFYNYFSAELGGIYTFNASEAGVQHRPWYAFLLGKLSIPLGNKLAIFTKFGVGYQNLIDYDDQDSDKWGPAFGAGLSYYFTPTVYIIGQWLRFSGDIENGVPQMSAPNIFLVGVGFKFLL
jgi:opacity protein-like surface antigen